MPPLVSILIPCYNAQRYIAEAVESALEQTHSNVEVVVVDDGSTDGSVGVLESFGDRIQFEAGPNRGGCAARNRALALSRGEYIQFLDADDMLEPVKIERQLPLLVGNQADLVFCKGHLLKEDGLYAPKKRHIASPDGVDPFLFCLRQGLATEGPLHRRTCLESVGGFYEPLRRGQETELHLRLAAADVRIALIDEHLYRHRDHNGPRITRTVTPADHQINLLIDLADKVTSGPPYRMTSERLDALASAIHQAAIHAYRHGAVEAAKRGFRRARQLSSSYGYKERGWYKLMSVVTGPMFAEHVLFMGRGIRDRFTANPKRAS